jgi:hypothetical protein
LDTEVDSSTRVETVPCQVEIDELGRTSRKAFFVVVSVVITVFRETSSLVVKVSSWSSTSDSSNVDVEGRVLNRIKVISINRSVSVQTSQRISVQILSNSDHGDVEHSVSVSAVESTHASSAYSVRDVDESSEVTIFISYNNVEGTSARYVSIESDKVVCSVWLSVVAVVLVVVRVRSSESVVSNEVSAGRIGESGDRNRSDVEREV